MYGEQLSKLKMTAQDTCDAYTSNFRKLPIYVAQFTADQ